MTTMPTIRHKTVPKQIASRVPILKWLNMAISLFDRNRHLHLWMKGAADFNHAFRLKRYRYFRSRSLSLEVKFIAFGIREDVVRNIIVILKDNTVPFFDRDLFSRKSLVFLGDRLLPHRRRRG